ncbi:hypothetical protein SLEP1_g52679 [Rubroshorea leprosula]|uniref:Uncharacterized protein n=1 Tax=Rubroshorea leprosula TaxID=152421 RepID=A0AAV5M7U0_9ROSI|nr:hypothetical protein SLEP1_g52679 [Rubroshorea leprosula]
MNAITQAMNMPEEQATGQSASQAQPAAFVHPMLQCVGDDI